MRKSRFRRMIIVLAVVLVFAFTTTAFATWYMDSASWSSSICLHGFTTTDKVIKLSDETWSSTTVYVDRVSFASKRGDAYLYATPKSSTGITMGSTEPCDPYTWPDIYIDTLEYTNRIYLRIDNPYPGDNMKSAGEWVGYSYK